MEYQRMNGDYYLRVLKGEHVPQAILELCRREGLGAATVTGIGACHSATLSTWVAEREEFTDHTVEGALEMVTFNGNVTIDHDARPFLHAHALFSYFDGDGHLASIAGHVKDAVIGYTGEIVVRPADAVIRRKWDEAAGIDVWDLPSPTCVDLR